MNKEEKSQQCISLIEDKITTLIIPRNVTKIRRTCFYGSYNLQTIIFEEPCQITELPHYCFRYCGIQSITIPHSVSTLDDSCFSDCGDLQSITIPNSVISLGIGCFSHCESLTEVIFEEPCQITELPQSCFSNEYYTTTNQIKEITIPSSITIINDKCFYNCPQLTTITINKPENSIAGAPWGATNATIVWNG